MINILDCEPRKFITQDHEPTENIANLCNFYNLDQQVVQTEFEEFRRAYHAVYNFLINCL